MAFVDGPRIEAAAGRAAHAPLKWAAALVLLGLTSGGRTFTPAIATEWLEAALALSSYACLLKSQGKFDEAVDVIQRAHALASESARITAEVGFYMHAAGRYEAEFPMLRRAVEQDARSADAWLHLGLGYARREEFAPAIAALEKARSLAAGDPRMEEWLTWARAQKRRGA